MMSANVHFRSDSLLNCVTFKVATLNDHMSNFPSYLYYFFHILHNKRVCAVKFT